MHTYDVVVIGGGAAGLSAALVLSRARRTVADVDAGQPRNALATHKQWGRELLQCPYCHGNEVRDRPLGVLGGTRNAVEHALLVRQWSDDVVHFPDTDVLTGDDTARLAARGIDVVAGRVKRLVIVDDRLDGVALEDGRVVRRTAAFVRPHMVPNCDLLATLGAGTDDRGWASADTTGRSSAAGSYIAGDAVNPRGQVITAGEGSAAANAINAELVDEDVTTAVLTAHA